MKSNLDKFFKTSGEPVWFSVSDETSFLVKPFSQDNPSVKAAMAHNYKPHAFQIDKGTIDQKKMLEISVSIFVEACLVDWKGVEIDGEEVKYDPKLAIQFLTGLPNLFNALWKNCQEEKNYLTDVGNS